MREAALYGGVGADTRPSILRGVIAVALTAVMALLATFSVEVIARGGATDVGAFLSSTARPGMTTVVMLTIVMLCVDAVLGRRFLSALVVLPLVLVPALVSNQKQHYLSDPLYPS